MTLVWQSQAALIVVLILSVIGLSAVLLGIRHASQSPYPQQSGPTAVWHEILMGSLLQVPLGTFLAFGN